MNPFHIDRGQLPAHFQVLPGGQTRLFDVSKCEKCGREVEGVNTIGGVATDASKYRELGLTEREMPESCLVWSDELGQAVCEVCYEWGRRRPADIKDAFLKFLEAEGVEGLIRLLEKVKAETAYDPVLEWLCEHAEAQRQKEASGART
ncbi:MAG: hypothetical protein ABFE07_28155 [Armatimonadia bacterium]